jgi:hypothetical protein
MSYSGLHDYPDDHQWVAVQEGPGLPYRGTKRPDVMGSSLGHWNLGPRNLPLADLGIRERLDARTLTSIDEILYEGMTDSETFFGLIMDAFRSTGFDPWAIVLFIMELPVLGHLLVRRVDKRDFLAGPFHARATCELAFPEYDGDETTIERFAPRLGCVVVSDKERMAAYGRVDPLFGCINRALAPLSTQSRWLCVTLPPPPDWVAERSSDDLELFRESQA